MSAQDRNDYLNMDLSTPGDVWEPTPHGVFLGEVLAANNMVRDQHVLELGGGAANHTIILLRQGARHVVVTEINETFLDTTRANVARNVPEADNIEFRVADWLDTPGKFDVVVTNPPFCKSGKRNRRYFIDSLILDSNKRLKEGGRLVFIQSSMADVRKTLRRLDENGYDARIIDSRRGPFRDYYFEDETFMNEMQHVPNGFKVRDGVHTETLYVVTGTLRPWSPPAGAHAVS